ncbi:MAG: co-chaperone GroES [Deltaproteobacteria bacterium]
MDKEIIIVGDRVLILPDTADDKTQSGLYLPQGVQEKEKVQAGRIVRIGPGHPIPDPSTLEAEPWQSTKMERYMPLQAREGDYCVFLRNAAIELEYDGKKYLIVPHSAILVLLRDKFDKID